MKNISKLTIFPKASIKDALAIIDSGAMKICIVLDDHKKLIGTISDGDIRRGLLKGIQLTDSIDKIICKTPLIAYIHETKDEILAKATKHQIFQIPILNNNNTVVGIEDIGEFFTQISQPNKVILMVGGKGSRLKPLTDHTPKPLLQIGGQPILENIIQNFGKYGFNNITLCVNHMSELIEDYFKDGSHLNVKISYLKESTPKGTAGSLKCLKDISEPFLVMNGDLLTKINFLHLLNYHQQNNSFATMCIREFDFQVPYGVVKVNENQQIIGISEKPTKKFYVNAGIYVLHPDALSFIDHDEHLNMPQLFQRILDNNRKTYSFPLREYWLDIGQHIDYQKAQDDFSKEFE